MDTNEFPDLEPEAIADRVRELGLPDHAHPGQHETVREAEHRGHHIVVRTTYSIEVDGKPIEGHLGVTADGTVHYHPVPNLAFPSAIEMVKQLIDTFPDDFADGDGHDHGDGHATHEHQH